MDLAKFVSLLATEQLFFARSDNLGDSFEGSLTIESVKALEEFSKEIIANDNGEGFPHGTPEEQYRRAFKGFRKSTFVNCWHMNNYESAAMWSLYSLQDQGIAITTTYENLAKSLPEEVFLGKVIYADYKDHLIPLDNSFWPFMHKRMSFQHENEVRAIYSNMSGKNNAPNISRVSGGVGVKVDLNSIVDRVYVHPDSPDWFFATIQSILERYEIPAKIFKSELANSPII